MPRRKWTVDEQAAERASKGGGKVCSQCSTWLPFDRYGKRTAARDGVAPMCKGCHASSPGRTPSGRREQRKRLANKAGRQYRTSDQLERQRNECAWDTLAERNAREAWEHWLTVRAPAWWLTEFRQTRYALNTEQRRRTWRRSRRKRKALIRSQSDGSLGINTTIAELYGRAQNCFYCGVGLTITRRQWIFAPTDATIDHVKPLSQGGRHSVDNIVVACRLCNDRKGTGKKNHGQGTVNPTPLRVYAAPREFFRDRISGTGFTFTFPAPSDIDGFCQNSTKSR